MLTTRDGRRLSYDDLGERSGHPVVYLHGTPDSRLAHHPNEHLLTEAGARLLAVDRPGYGASSAPPDGASAREVGARFSQDLGELLDHLGLTQATLLAWSGGALQALTAAVELGHRINGLTVVAGVAPREAYDDPAVAEASPDRRAMLDAADDMAPTTLAEMLAPMLAPYPCDQALAAEHQREHRSDADQEALDAIPGAADQMAAALAEAVRGGLEGVAADVGAQHYPGSIPSLSALRLPVQLWYGTDDHVTPAAIGRWYAQQLADAQLYEIDGAGHTIFFTHWTEILQPITA